MGSFCPSTDNNNYLKHTAGAAMHIVFEMFVIHSSLARMDYKHFKHNVHHNAQLSKLSIFLRLIL